MNHHKIYGLNFILFALTCLCLIGCVSGYFKLDPQSRLPTWFNNKNNIPREKLNIEITIYERTTSPKGKVNINISSNGKIIQGAEGTWCYHPKSLKKSENSPPNWIIIDINGVQEIYEHRERNDILKIVDNVDA